MEMGIETGNGGTAAVAEDERTYEIFEGNMEKLEKKMAHIQNKCGRFGCEFSYEQTGEVFREVRDGKDGTCTLRFVCIRAHGRAVVNGWKFVATVDHTEKGNIFSGPGVTEVPRRYYDAPPVCEHCNSRRCRRHTYIVANVDTGEFKQVGRTCLADFTRGLDAGDVARYMSLFGILEECSAPCAGGGYGHYAYICRKECLMYAAETIRHFGYRKSSCDRSTASRVLDYYNAEHGRITGKTLRAVRAEMDSVGFDLGFGMVSGEVEQALGWIGRQQDDGNYIHNLKVACALDFIPVRNVGLLVSLLPAYHRDVEKERKRDAEECAGRESVHVGNMGERITLEIGTCRCVTSWDTDFGKKYLYRITGEDGNVYTWKTGKSMDEAAVCGKTMKGTVKNHAEFHGVKQTELTRCSIGT